MLRNTQKVQVFEPRRGSALLPTEPVVGGKAILLGEDNKVLVALDRKTLSVLWRARVGSLGPVGWWGDDRLILQGDTAVGVWHVPGRRLDWRAKTEVGLGCEPWGDYVLSWKAKDEVELREIQSGEVKSTIRVPPPPVRFATRCASALICRSAETGDPIRAVRLDNGAVIWDRNLMHEMRLAYGIEAPLVSIVAGSVLGHFVVMRGSAMLGCSIESGEILWKADVRVPYYWPLVEGGRIPVYSDLDMRFAVIDEATGAILCDRRYPELRPMYRVKRGSILGNLVAFVSESGHVAAFRLDNGDLVFLEQRTRVAFWGTAVADGRLLASGSDGNLWVYEGAST